MKNTLFILLFLLSSAFISGCDNAQKHSNKNETLKTQTGINSPLTEHVEHLHEALDKAKAVEKQLLEADLKRRKMLE